MNDIHHILVVNVNWMGDVIFSSPIFRALKKQYPQSRISCLAVPRVREILESIPEIDEIIVYDEARTHKGLIGKFQIIQLLRSKKFDVAFLLHRSWTRAFLVFLAGIKLRVGYDTKERGVMLTHRVEPDPSKVHRLEYYLQVIESFGVGISDQRTKLSLNPQARLRVKEILSQKGLSAEPFIVMHPSGNWDLKRWPVRYFTELIEKILAEGHFKVVITGTSADQDLVQSIVDPLKQKPILLTGLLSLKELMALMPQSHCVISADSGPIHLANSVGAKVIGLFGPTRPEITGPRGIAPSIVLQHDVGCNRKACYYLQCPDNVCMQSISVENVLKAIREI